MQLIMNLNAVFLNLNIFVLYMSHYHECKRIYSNYTEEFINLAVISDHVYIGGKHSLIQLNSSLEIVNIKPMAGSNWLLTPYTTTDERTILIACDYEGEYTSDCIGLRRNLSIAKGYNGSDIKIKEPHARYTTTTIGSSNVLTIASSDCVRPTSSEECFAISNYQEEINKYDKYTVEYLKVNGVNAKVNLDFKTVVGTGTYIYFLFALNNTVSKLGKICVDPVTSNVPYNAYEDVPIICSHNGVNFPTAQDLMFWNDDLLVVFADGTASVICRFTNLFDNFQLSRIERLRCPYKQQIEKNKYFKNPSKDVCYNEAERKCKSNVIAGSEDDCPEMTNGFCSPSVFSSVEGDIPMKGDVVYHSQNSAVGSIVKMTDAMIVDEFVILYVGTSKGHIGKIFINDTDAFSLGDFKIVQWLSPVIDIKKDGENVYAMTKHLIANVADIGDCGASSTCEDCMKSENSMCGWDIVNQSCNKNFVKPFWVPSAGKKCLTIKSAGIAVDENDSISREAAISFELIPSIHLSELKYVIQINSSSETNLANLYKEDYKTINVNMSYNDVVRLNVTDTNGTVIASTQIMLYKCRTATSCISCVQNRDCHWCPLKVECNLMNDSCDGQIKPKEEYKCPKINNSKDLLITYGTTKNLSVDVMNVDIYNNTQYMKCAVNNATYDATVFSNTAVCQNVVAPNAMHTNYDVRLLYKETRLDGRANLNVYQCHNLENVDGNCGYCKYWKGQGYDCDWCNNGCRSTVSGSCSSQRCNVKVIKVFPASGTENGGTKLTIYGQNIGNPNNNITVKIYGVECVNVEVLRPSSVITCMTGNVNNISTTDSNSTISINGNITTFPANQLYSVETDLAILNFTPNKSIEAGGREISITGNSALFDSRDHTYGVKFCTNDNATCIQCRDTRPAGMKTITCRMEKSNGILLTLHKLTVTVDNNTALNYTGMFRFVVNPTIYPLSPKNATVFRSGGIKLTIEGKGFLDVGEVHVNNMENPCTISSDTIVECDTPPYVSSDFERRKRSIGQAININYDDYQNLSTIYYIDDPFFEKLALIEYDKKSTILIKGRNLLEGAKQDDYFVQIGLDGRCIVEKITNNNITCLPPKEVPRTNHNDDNTVFIMVKVGRIRENIGNLKYVSEIPVMIIVIAVLATAFVAAVVIGVATVLVIRQRKIKAEENFEMEQISREEKIRDASREDH